MSQPSVSVAIATFNGARHIERQIRSLMKQPPGEIVVVDDCSTDETYEILVELSGASTIPFRPHLNKERLGYPATIVRAVKLCTSELVTFCDEDHLIYRRDRFRWLRGLGY